MDNLKMILQIKKNRNRPVNRMGRHEFQKNDLLIKTVYFIIFNFDNFDNL